MFLSLKRAALAASVVVVGFVATAEAQYGRTAQLRRAARNVGARPVDRVQQRPTAVQPVYYAAPKKMVIEGGAKPAAKAAPAPRGYVHLDAPLYSSPVQNVPHQVGGTFITNQAFAPHEMLHAHTYKAMYGPFYYKVRGSWFVWPCGVESYDRWELMGTEVKVEYRSHIPMFSRFSRPWFK